MKKTDIIAILIFDDT